MTTPSRLRLFYLLHLSKPSSDRPIYKELCRNEIRKIVELGVGTGQRAVRMIQTASEFCSPGEIFYTGIDPFETRSEQDGPGLSLKEAHCLLKTTGARIQLAPGKLDEALPRVANLLGKVDLLLISGRADDKPLSAMAWFYLPRLLHEQTQVFLETLSGGNATLRLLDHAEIEQQAGLSRRRAA